MSVTIATKNGEQLFNKNVVTVGTQSNCDVVVNSPVQFVLSIELNPAGGCLVTNLSQSPQILFRGQPMGAQIPVQKACKLMVAGTDDFVGIKLATVPQVHANGQPQRPMPRPQGQPMPPRPQGQRPQRPMNGGQPQRPHPPVRRPQPQPQVTMTAIAQQDFDEDDIRELYGDNVNAATKIKLDKRKADIEARRVAILKEISFALDDAKKKITANGMAEKFLFLALIICPIIMASALSDTLATLIPPAAKSVFPLHMRLLAGYALLLFVNGLVLKQGIFLLLQDKVKDKNVQKTGAVAKNFMLMLSTAIFVTIGIVVLNFYLDPNTPLEQGPTIVSMVALFALILCSICGGYFRSTMNEAVIQYDKYENREDFKKVLQDYQQWIGMYINNISSVKLKNLRDKQFMLKLKAAGEVGLGILTSPFLAYAVSNTLGLCIPDAAGWIKLGEGGLRITPVFLFLATCMIIFAFFTLTAAFVDSKRVAGAEVMKKDGFGNYMNHGVDMFGSEAIKKLKADGFRSLMIALSVIAIEFTMNASYFMQEIGGAEWSGIMMSLIAALVPTALLVAETFMLAHTQYEIHICDEIFSRLDKEIDE